MDSDEKSYSPEDREEIAALYRHMDNLVHTRINALLLSQAVLFAVSSVLATANLVGDIVAFLGLAITIVWWLAIQVVHKKLSWLSEQYREASTLFGAFHSVGRPTDYPPLLNDRAGLLLCQILPAMFFFFWVILLIARASEATCCTSYV